MPDTSTGAYVTAAVSLLGAVLSGGFVVWNSKKSNETLLALQDLKGTVDRDLEKLRAKLSHGQIVNSTQWSTEFGAYQAIWKGMVAVRTIASKIVFHDDELMKLGLPDDFLTSAQSVDTRKEFLKQFTQAASNLLFGIQDNAPFYPPGDTRGSE